MRIIKGLHRPFAAVRPVWAGGAGRVLLGTCLSRPGQPRGQTYSTPWRYWVELAAQFQVRDPDRPAGVDCQSLATYYVAYWREKGWLAMGSRSRGWISPGSRGKDSGNVLPCTYPAPPILCFSPATVASGPDASTSCCTGQARPDRTGTSLLPVVDPSNPCMHACMMKEKHRGRTVSDYSVDRRQQYRE